MFSGGIEKKKQSEMDSVVGNINVYKKDTRATQFSSLYCQLWKLISINAFNRSYPDPGRREKINLNFYFYTSSWCLKRFWKNFQKCKGREGLKLNLNKQLLTGTYIKKLLDH